MTKSGSRKKKPSPWRKIKGHPEKRYYGTKKKAVHSDVGESQPSGKKSVKTT